MKWDTELGFDFGFEIGDCGGFRVVVDCDSLESVSTADSEQHRGDDFWRLKIETLEWSLGGFLSKERSDGV